MKGVITKKVYKVTLECKEINRKWAKEDGQTFGLKCMDDMFLATMSALQLQRKNPWSMEASKSRKVEVELISAEE